MVSKVIILISNLHHFEVPLLANIDHPLPLTPNLNGLFSLQAHAKYVKCRQALDFCESSYQTSVSIVEEARVAWEKETERTFLSFQCLVKILFL